MTWDELIAAHGDEEVVSSERGGGVRLLHGCAGGNSDGVTAYADGLRIEQSGQNTVFDFERP